MVQYERCDPETMKIREENTKICKMASERWVDNAYEIEDFVKKNMLSMSEEERHKAFPVLKDLDYAEYVIGKKWSYTFAV